MRAVAQGRRKSITAAANYMLVVVYLAVVTFVCLSAEGLPARAAETLLALVPAALVLAGLRGRRLVRRLQNSTAEERRRHRLIGVAVVLAVLLVLAGTWIYAESQPPPPMADLYGEGPPTISG